MRDKTYGEIPDTLVFSRYQIAFDKPTATGKRIPTRIALIVMGYRLIEEIVDKGSAIFSPGEYEIMIQLYDAAKGFCPIDSRLTGTKNDTGVHRPCGQCAQDHEPHCWDCCEDCHWLVSDKIYECKEPASGT